MGSFLHEFIEAVPGAVYAKDREGRVLLGNSAFAEAVGCSRGNYVGKNDLELLSDKEFARAVMENDRRIMAGQARSQLEERLRAEDGSITHWLSTKAPFTNDCGEIVGLVGVSIDITERKRLEERQRLLAREIEHRNKNLLDVVQSVVRLTTGATTEEFREAVLGRLDALSRAHGLLTRADHQKVDLRDLLLEELAAYDIDGENRVDLCGPPVSIGTDAAQPLAMAFHELATNAAKYGAFATPGGALDVRWDLCQPQGTQLAIHWLETGNTPVEKPERNGFGSRLIRSVVEQQLQGELSLSWKPNGLRYSICVPVENIARD